MNRKTKKRKGMKAYLSVEAAFIMPVVLFLYLAIILLAVFLYDRCVISQDYYLLALRGSRFSAARENYAEVIYGKKGAGSLNREYLLDRMERKNMTYPFYRQEKENIVITDNSVVVSSKGFGGKLEVEKKIKQENPMELIRKRRASH